MILPIPPKFYVYAYLRSRSSKYGSAGSPYYIGKGSGKRAFTKYRGEIYPPHDKSLIKIIASNLDELSAFQLEKTLVQQYGRIDLTTGCLRNKADGGIGGASGSVHSLTNRKATSERMKTKWENSEFRLAMAEVSKRKWESTELRNRMAEALKSRGSMWPKGKKHGAMSEATKKKVSQAKKGTGVKTHCKQGHLYTDKSRGYHICRICDNRKQRERYHNRKNPPLPKTYCKYGHPFIGDNDCRTNKGHRYCKTCVNAKSLAAYHKKFKPILTQCKRGHLFIGDNVRKDKNGHPYCLICRRSLLASNLSKKEI